MNMKYFLRRLAWGCSVGLLLAVMAPQVQAANILILSTLDNEPDMIPSDTRDALINFKKEFSTPDNTVHAIENMADANVLTAQTFADTHYDLVVFAQLQRTIEASNLAALQAAISNRSANGFALFYDTGGLGTSQPMLDILNASAGIVLTGTTIVLNDVALQLNTNSPYQASFSDLNTLSGGYFFYMHGVPAPNVLYTAPGAALPAVGADASVLVDNVYSVFVPATQSYAGTGACLIATADISMFESRNYYDDVSKYNPNAAITTPGSFRPNSTGVHNEGKIAPAFLKALAPGGSCGIAASISKQFSPQTVGPGDVSTLTITVGNASTTDVTNANMTDNLPAPLVVSGAASTSCTGGTLTAALDTATINLSGATVPAGGCTVTVPVRWPAANAALCVTPTNVVTNTITPGTDFTTGQGQTSTVATDTLTCEAGSLTLAKRIDWQTGSVPSDLSNTTYTMAVNCASSSGDAMPEISVPVTVDATGNGAQVLTPVVANGSCTVSETNRATPPVNH